MDQFENAPITPTALARAAEISVPYASQLLARDRTASVALAVRVFRKTGVRVKPIEQATDEEIDVLERFGGDAA